MSAAPFRAIGGAVVSDHETLTLARARELAAFYAREATHLPQTSLAHRLCAARANALRAAARAAWQWRRAAGWRDPEAADLTHP